MLHLHSFKELRQQKTMSLHSFQFIPNRFAANKVSSMDKQVGGEQLLEFSTTVAIVQMSMKKLLTYMPLPYNPS